MTWERFGYICRKASVDYQEQESISACLSRIEGEESCDLYGKKINVNSLPRKILSQIGKIDNIEEAMKVINIYSRLSLTKSFEEPMRFKRVVAYLSYVTFIFYVVVGIYQLKVAPSFLAAFDNFDISIPKHLTFYQDYWGYFVLVVSLCLISALLIGFKLRRLFRFELGVEKSLIFRFFILENIRKSYLRAIYIVQYPYLSNDHSYSSEFKLIKQHLDSVAKSKMDISTELQKLIEIEMQSLLEICERQMKSISIAVALIIVAAVFLFLASAYSPIFILGETV